MTPRRLTPRQMCRENMHAWSRWIVGWREGELERICTRNGCDARERKAL